MTLKNLYVGYTITQKREFMERREKLRARKNWDAHFARVIRETKRRVDG